MEYEKIKELMADMNNSQLSEINIDFPDGTKIIMKKNVQNEKTVSERTNEQNLYKECGVKKDSEKCIDEKGIDEKIVKSPMVGTFYTKSSPTSKPYVEIGDCVKKGDTLCIIEAMKLMNELESEFAGKVEEILVKDGEVVEYGTPLFRIGE